MQLNGAPDSLHISRTYAQGRTAVLAVDLAASSRGLLAVQGAVTLRGRLIAHDVGSCNPALGTRVLGGSTVTGSLSCATTSGWGSGTRYWMPGYSSRGLYLTWRSGRHTSC